MLQRAVHGLVQEQLLGFMWHTQRAPGAACLLVVKEAWCCITTDWMSHTDHWLYLNVHWMSPNEATKPCKISLSCWICQQLTSNQQQLR